MSCSAQCFILSSDPGNLFHFFSISRNKLMRVLTKLKYTISFLYEHMWLDLSDTNLCLKWTQQYCWEIKKKWSLGTNICFSFIKSLSNSSKTIFRSNGITIAYNLCIIVNVYILGVYRDIYIQTWKKFYLINSVLLPTSIFYCKRCIKSPLKQWNIPFWKDLSIMVQYWVKANGKILSQREWTQR